MMEKNIICESFYKCSCFSRRSCCPIQQFWVWQASSAPCDWSAHSRGPKGHPGLQRWCHQPAADFTDRQSKYSLLTPANKEQGMTESTPKIWSYSLLLPNKHARSLTLPHTHIRTPTWHCGRNIVPPPTLNGYVLEINRPKKPTESKPQM